MHDQFERFCRARVYGDMDYKDLVNETLLVAFEKFESIKNQKAFLSFLFSTSVRILSNKNKKKKPGTGLSDDYQILDTNSSSATQAEVYFLHRALSMLPDEQKEAVILFEISGFSIKEICEIQQASESAVKQRLKRGREKLTNILTFESEYKTTGLVSNE